MNEQFMKQLVAELVEAQGQALGIVVTALCEHVDAAQLKTALHRSIEAAKKMQSTSPTAIRMAAHALAAAEAEAMLRAKPLSEGPHPKRTN